MGKLKNFLFISSLLLGGGCASVGEYGSISPPKNMGDACAILNEKSSWQKPTFEAAYQWKVSPGTILSFMRYESSFRHDARPVDSKGNLMSSALGYSQALNKTWSDYETARGKGQRQNFDDSADFIGWYINILSNKAFVAKDDPTNLYLAYHEGIGGYLNGTYLNKAWLVNYANKVGYLASIYDNQLNRCQSKQMSKFNKLQMAEIKKNNSMPIKIMANEY